MGKTKFDLSDKELADMYRRQLGGTQKALRIARQKISELEDQNARLSSELDHLVKKLAEFYQTT